MQVIIGEVSTELDETMSNRLRNISCLVCGNKESRVVFPGRWGALEKKELGSYFSSSRVRAVYSQIVRCTRCGFVYANPQPSPIELERIYQGLVDEAYASEEPARIVTARRMLDVVENWDAKRGRLLDVGCSGGLFLECAQQRGWRALGVEPSLWALEQCRRRGVIAYRGVAESISLVPEIFDVVTMWDVLEHSVDPRRVLESAYTVLKPGGLLFIDVPDIDSVTARFMKQRWPLLLLEHLWYFSPSTLGRLVAEAGFHLLSVFPRQVTFSLGFIITRLAQQGIFPRILAAKLESLAFLRQLYVNFTYGEMTAIAQKA